jgi:uncharacterized protein YndB with AHSA1/START domain
MSHVLPPKAKAVVSRVFQVDAQRLYRAWTDPQQLQHWWRMNTPGWAFALASIDLRVGGNYRLGMTGSDGKLHVAHGTYREVNEPVRLVFTWDWEDHASGVGLTLVTIDFVALDAKSTELKITHERFNDPARIEGHERGWTQLLELLDNHFTKAVT